MTGIYPAMRVFSKRILIHEGLETENNSDNNSDDLERQGVCKNQCGRTWKLPLFQSQAHRTAGEEAVEIDEERDAVQDDSKFCNVFSAIINVQRNGSDCVIKIK